MKRDGGPVRSIPHTRGVDGVMAKGRIAVLESFCKSCGLCVEACPVNVLRISDKINSKGFRPVEQYKEGCIACGMCATICPDAAIEVYKFEEDA